MIRRGEIWWIEQPDQKRRPALVLTRDVSIGVLRDVMVAPISTRRRGLATEVEVGDADGVPRSGVVNAQHVQTVPKAFLRRRLGELAPGRWHEVCSALRAAIEC